MNFLTAEQLAHHGHVELDGQCETGNLRGRLGHPTHDRQIDRSYDEARLVVDEAGPAKVHPLAPLCDHDDSRMVGHPAWRGRRSPLVEADTRNRRCPILFLAQEGGNPLRELCLRPAGSVRF